MARFYIIDAKAGLGDGPGPASVPTVAEAYLWDGAGKEFYLSLCEFEGTYMFIKTEESTYKLLLSQFDEDDAAYLEDHEIRIGEPEDIFADPEHEMYDIARYLIYLVRCEMGKEQPFIEKTKGHWTDEIEIPKSDLEEDWEEDSDEEDWDEEE